MSGMAIAMWSGPRNISTAMMRAWENREDTQVIDEPFYAHYLKHTGKDHPLADEVIAAGETDWRAVIKQIEQVPKDGIFYQKHITTHWLAHYSTDWLARLSHVFLIRSPVAVAASYANKRESLNAFDLGFEQQSALFDIVRAIKGSPPLVVDSYRFLNDPGNQLRFICNALGIAFQKQMLRWPSGSRGSDGLWGRHWYDAVNNSTGFAAPRSDLPVLDDNQQAIARMCQPHYDKLKVFAL